MSRQPTVRAGKKLGRYRIERELGRGGMGVVYVALDEHTGRQIALKTTSVAGMGAEKARNQRRQRFVREVKALTQLNHSNVVHVLDAGEADDPDLGWLLFYSMEFVDGETLAQLVQRIGALKPGVAAAVLMQVGAGLGAAHRAHIVHRDVKPANIFISLDGRALIGDFGICKIEGQTQITRRDQLVGTPNYLAPEQILGDPVGPATDVFALGALFYVITMNRPLRTHVDAASLLASAQSNEPREQMLAERSIPEPLRKVIARCLERDPKKRWADGTQLSEALVEFASRIPSRDETLGDPLNDASSTADRSSPFVSLPSAPTGGLDDASADLRQVAAAGSPPPGVPGDVEAAALAMLDEVARRDVSVKKKVERPEPVTLDKPLPVAKTESTVMFNIRALEPPPVAARPLPVAKTESTVIYQLRGGANPSPAPDGEDEETLRHLPTPGAADAEGAGGLHDAPTDTGMNMPGSTRRGATERRRGHASRTLPSLQFDLPKLSRPTWLGVTGASGALAGIILVLLLAPPSSSAAEQSVAGPVPDAAHTRPALCPEVRSGTISPEHAAHAKDLRDKALAAMQRAENLVPVKEGLEESIKYYPLDPAAFYGLAQVYAKLERSADADAAYACVCMVSETSSECQVLRSRASKRAR